MENCEKFFETVNKFKKDIGLVGKATSIKELNDLELKCVRELQLMIVEVEMCGRDLRTAREKRDRELRNG